MSGHPSENELKTMIGCFQLIHLQNLLRAFNLNRNGRKSELLNRALELFINRPADFHYTEYQSKIVEIYLNIMENRQRLQEQRLLISSQPRLFQTAPPTNHPQQQIGLPQVIPESQRANNIPGTIHYDDQLADPRQIVSRDPRNQQSNAIHQNSNTFTLSSQSLENIKLKKLPFYEVLCDVLKPTILDGREFCSKPEIKKDGMRELKFDIKMLPEHINYVSLNRFNSKFDLYQIQIRICALGSSAEITDFFPYELHIRINDEDCKLPSIASNNRPGALKRRIPYPIHCSPHFKLSPIVSNTIIVNWVPDSKTYIMAVNIVKKLSSTTLLKRLHEKETRSSEDTKNDIIEKMANNIDSDITTTSHQISLVCPFSKKRIGIPAKSAKCDHLQFFDANTFLSMNEIKPSWVCPTCYNSCQYDDLQIQSYFLEVLMSSSLPNSCKEIELFADGTWRPYEENIDTVQSVSDNEKNLEDSEDENSTDVHKVANQESSDKQTEIVKTSIIDVTMRDVEKFLINKDKQVNEAHAINTEQAASVVNLHAHAQPQQALTNLTQELVINVDDNPSPPV